ncbi:MAG: hypothetical protein EHM40_03215 [Chloroflexi bacterium]|nr:MAG: hypothetical protein EHM40_03215 [Chloroflexota bacterium]
MDTNPAYVKWVEMTKDGEEKPVHPGNVKAHENAGWARKVPIDQPVAVETPAPEQPTAVESKVPEKKTKGSGRKKAEPKAPGKKAAPEAKPTAPAEDEAEPVQE